MGVFKRSHLVGTSVRSGSADDMILNPTLAVLSDITHDGWNFQEENRILLYLNIFKYFLYAGRVLQGEHGVTAMIYHLNISAFVDEKNHQISKNVSIVTFTIKLRHLSIMAIFVH